MREIALLLVVFVCSGCSGVVFIGSRTTVSDGCTPEKNQRLLDLLNSGESQPVDNVMVCGVTISPSRTQAGGPHGSHQVLPLHVAFPDGSSKLIEVVTNDDLDGPLTAPEGASVSAYGQAFFDHTGHFAAGIHDVHCSTHRSAEDGWVMINGRKFPKHC